MTSLNGGRSFSRHDNETTWVAKVEMVICPTYRQATKNRSNLRVQGHPARSSLTTSPSGRAVWSPTMALLKAASMAEKREALETGRLSRGWFSGRLSTEKDRSAARNRSALTALESGAARAGVCRSLVARKSCPGSATASPYEVGLPVRYKVCDLPVRHAHREHRLVVLSVNANHVLRRRGRCIREQRNQQWHVVHMLNMVPNRRDPVREPGLQPTMEYRCRRLLRSLLFPAHAAATQANTDWNCQVLVKTK